MALLGTFSAGEGAGAPTTGSRTSVSGSLVVAMSGHNSGSSGEVISYSDSLANTITKALQQEWSSAPFRYVGLGYNIGGTRGASHTLSSNDCGGNAITGAEFDGIESSPTIATNHNTGTGTSATVDVAVSAASTVIGVLGYAGAATTVSVADGTELIEGDENNDRGSNLSAYKLAGTGTVTLGWTLAASRNWKAIIVSFTEVSAATGQPSMRRWGGVPHMGKGQNLGRSWMKRASGIFEPNRKIFIGGCYA